MKNHNYSHNYFRYFINAGKGILYLPLVVLIFAVRWLFWILLYLFDFIYDTNKKEAYFNKEIAFDNNEIKTSPNKKELLETIAVKTGKKLHIIPIAEVVCIQAYGDYVNIMTLQGTYLKENTLKYFEEHLPNTQFLRVHRSYIVNIHAIKIIESYARDQYLLILSNNEKIKSTADGCRKLKMALKL